VVHFIVYAKYLEITQNAINFEEQNWVPLLLQDKYKNEFKLCWEICSESFGIVCKVIDKNCNKIDAINKIALNKQELEKAFKELNLMNKLKNPFVVEYIDSWIEEKTSVLKPQSCWDMLFASSHWVLLQFY